MKKNLSMPVKDLSLENSNPLKENLNWWNMEAIKKKALGENNEEFETELLKKMKVKIN